MLVTYLWHTSPQSVNINNWTHIKIIGLRKIHVMGEKIPRMLRKKMEFLTTLYTTLISARNSCRHPHFALISDPIGTYYTATWNTSAKSHLEPEFLWRWPHDYVIWNNTTPCVIQKSLTGSSYFHFRHKLRHYSRPMLWLYSCSLIITCNTADISVTENLKTNTEIESILMLSSKIIRKTR